MQFWTKCCQLFELPPSLPPDSIFHLHLLTNSGQKRFNAKDETMTILTAFLCRSRPGWNEVQDSLQVRGGEVDHILRLRPNHQGDKIKQKMINSFIFPLQVIRANFGRFSIAICNRHGTTDMSVNCMSPSSNRVMKRK